MHNLKTMFNRGAFGSGEECCQELWLNKNSEIVEKMSDEELDKKILVLKEKNEMSAPMYRLLTLESSARNQEKWSAVNKEDDRKTKFEIKGERRNE